MLTFDELSQNCHSKSDGVDLPQPGQVWQLVNGSHVLVKRIAENEWIGPLKVVPFDRPNAVEDHRTRDGRHTIFGGRMADPLNLLERVPELEPT